MNIYIDESGSINNHSTYEKDFVICLVHVYDKKPVLRTYKRFVSSNLERLKQLDVTKVDKRGKTVREGGKMFKDGKFIELKGTQFDREMKHKFVEAFSHTDGFELFYIRLDNSQLVDSLCKDISTAFNYPLRLAIETFIKRHYFLDEPNFLQLDERNEKTDKKYFLEQYLNTELIGRNIVHYPFKVEYFDSATNKCVQIADVFANLYYSHLKTDKYTQDINLLRETNKIRFIFKFPL